MSLRGAIDRFLLVLLEQIPQPVWLRGIRCDCYRWWTPSDHHHVVVLEYPPFCRGYRDRLWLRWGIIYHQRVAVVDSRGRHRRDGSRCRCSDRGWRRTCLRGNSELAGTTSCRFTSRPALERRTSSYVH